MLVGMITGYLSAYVLGLISSVQLEELDKAYIVWFPFIEHPGWSFDLHLVLPFLIAMLCSTLKSVGDITTCQKINDADWKRPDMDNIGKGILADSIGCMSAGILGGVGQSTSSTNIGLSIATGITSRVIAYAMGAMLILLGFVPKISTLFAIIPKPVLGATIIFAVCYMVIVGFQIIMSRMIDGRKTFIIGLSLIFGLSVDLLPGIFQNMHPAIQPIFSSSLSTATIAAILLNLVLKIGVAKKVQLEVPAEIGSLETVHDFMDKNGRVWGARGEVISLSINALNEFLEAFIEHDLTEQPVRIVVSFDEFNLDIDLFYHGTLFDFPDHHPATAGLLNNKNDQLRLSGFLIRQYADKITAEARDGLAHIRLHFEH